jgi:hypothetical protein
MEASRSSSECEGAFEDPLSELSISRPDYSSQMVLYVIDVAVFLTLYFLALSLIIFFFRKSASALTEFLVLDPVFNDNFAYDILERVRNLSNFNFSVFRFHNMFFFINDVNSGQSNSTLETN